MTTGPALRLAHLAAGVSFATAAALAPTGPGWASVTVDQQSAVQGAYATVVFNVRNDRPDVSTTGLDINFPADHALTEVLTQPKPGWVVTVERNPVASSPAPEGSGAGHAAERVAKVRWAPAAGSAAIGPHQFDLFSVSVGPLPAGVEKLVFQAVQTYSDGQSVSWSDEAAGSPGEPARPAPVLMLDAAAPTAEAPTGAAPEASPAPATAADTPAPQPEETSLAAAELASASGPEESQAAGVTLGLSIGVGLILLGVAGAAVARRRTDPSPGRPAR